IPAHRLAARNSACRWRKYAGLPPVNLLASAVAIEEEYTITMPNVSRRSAAHRTPLSYSASAARPGLMFRSIDDPFHRQAKYFAPMLVVTEHVEARAGGRKQTRVARARRLRSKYYSLVQGGGAQYRDARPRDRRFDQRRVAADEHERARRARHGIFQGRKILSLAVASGDENQLRIALREPGESGNRRADVGALGVVEPAQPVRFADQLDAMRKPFELAQRRKQGLGRQAERAAERERGERIGGVVQPGELQFPHRKERVCALREPALAATLEQTPVLRAPWDLEAEADRLSARQRHCEAARVIAVEHLDAVARKDPRFGASVVVDAAVAVQMVFADVEYRSRVSGERGGLLELEAGELQHPQARGLSLVFTAHQCVQHGRPDVAGDFAVGSRSSRHRAGERRNGALTVGARHRDDLRAALRERLREQLDVAYDLHARSEPALHGGFRERHARARGGEIDTSEYLVPEQAAMRGDGTQRALELCKARRRLARHRSSRNEAPSPPPIS